MKPKRVQTALLEPYSDCFEFEQEVAATVESMEKAARHKRVVKAAPGVEVVVHDNLSGANLNSKSATSSYKPAPGYTGIDAGLIDLPMGGKMFTWMNKTGTKLSKLDRFLVSDGVLHAHSHMQVTVLDKVWSDHNPILLHSKNSDFGQTPFKLFHSWFDRIGFDDVVKEAWNYFSFEVHGSIVTFHDKFSGLQTHLKLWYSRTKDSEHSRKQSILHSLRLLDENIDAGRANDEDKELRVNTLLELEGLDKFESMDLIQKAQIK
ncbi:RNA-directed DNA polymerase, eukaryota, reverse transcriptase zinc-binding domain protein [Tanacetum coccineum]